jgi:ATP-dependent Lhr-like helicase
LREQHSATGHLPTDRTLLVERFRDELGDWRLVLHSPYGQPVHAPWALAVGARLRERFGVDGAPTAADDGIVVRLPDTTDDPPGAELFVFEPDEIHDLVTEQVGGSALFASRFRECAARALLLPRRDPGRRAPLWQQRQRAAQLLDVARKFPDFPMLLETARECLQDVYDLPALAELQARIARRKLRLVEVETATPSPFANALLFDYIGQFMYEGDTPLAERRAAALSLDSGLLAELLGRVELRELLDAAVLELTERELQRLTPERHARDGEGLADLLRLLGPLTPHEATERCTADPRPWFAELVRARRALEVSFAGRQWWAAVEDAARLRDALGVPLPIGTPAAFIEPVADPLGDLVGRYARTHGPFGVAALAGRFGLGSAVAATALHRLAAEKRVVEGEFTPGSSGAEWCDNQVLRRLRRRSLAAARKEVEPVATAAFARFLPAWHHVGTAELRGLDGVYAVVEQLAGVPIPASAWETLILPARVRDYSPAMLDHRQGRLDRPASRRPGRSHPHPAGRHRPHRNPDPAADGAGRHHHPGIARIIVHDRKLPARTTTGRDHAHTHRCRHSTDDWTTARFDRDRPRERFARSPRHDRPRHPYFSDTRRPGPAGGSHIRPRENEYSTRAVESDRDRRHRRSG